jgi:hypothetical protein
VEVVLGLHREEIERVRAAYPCLLWSETVAGHALEGSFPVLHGGKEIDAFSVRIELAKGTRGFVPRVLEVGGRIPRIADRHVYESDGTACIGLPEELLVATRGEPLTLSDFLDGPVRSFFLAQAIFECEGIWPFGDRRHGDDGLHDFYEETFGSRNPIVIGAYLKVLRSRSVRGHWPCPCGSGYRIRSCHLSEVAAMRRRIPCAVARRLSPGQTGPQ